MSAATRRRQSTSRRYCVRIQATNPDFIYVASHPTHTVGIVRGAHEIGLRTKLFDGGMVGAQYAAVKTQRRTAQGHRKL
jgi:ABC-type branched-subunit amino acid transport system substrate-binding protein